ncbi:MAG: hypothetical protein HYT22_01280 [Candidatus Niyogibacteria bacterium]|nr:hypothetical protein [Candidatus Niyogibacteria bacterium]
MDMDMVRRKEPDAGQQAPAEKLPEPQPPPAGGLPPIAATPEPKPDIKTPLVSWSAPEYDFVPKSREWYWAVGIIVAALVIVAALIRNLLFGILTVLAGFTIALYGARRPKIVKFAVTARGVQIGEKLHSYESLESFWIRYDPPHTKELDIISKKLTSPRITIPLGDADPIEIRNILIKTLKETETEESLAEGIGRYLGF